MAELQKAKIIVLETAAGQEQSISCLFNPSEYTLKEGVTYAKKNDQGKDGTDYQYIHGDGTELSLTLYFDTTGTLNHGENLIDKEAGQTAVTAYTKKIEKLMRIEGSVHRPPKIAFSWGNLYFKGVLTSLNQSFTYFGMNGKPLRAKLDLTIAAVADPTAKWASPFESPDRTKYRTIVQGMPLWKMAYEEYGDCERWKEIARANGLLNPLDVAAGDVVTVPPLKEGE